MARIRRFVCLVIVVLMSIPLPSAFSDWTRVEVTPSASCTFPPGGGTCVTGLKVPVDGVFNGANLSITGQPLLVDNLLSLNSSALWNGATGRGNVSSSSDGIGLGGLGSWWEETASEAWWRAPEWDRNGTGTIGVNGSVLDNLTLDVSGSLSLLNELRQPFKADEHTVGLWHFDENSGAVALDSSGKGNNATLVNGPSWIEGRFGKALRFNGVDQYASATSNSFPVSNQARTLELRARSSDFKKGSTCLAGWGAEASTQTCAIITGLNNHQDGAFAFWGYNYDFESKSTLTDNIWHHIAFTYNGSAGTLYLDGVPESNQSLSLTTGSGSTFWMAYWLSCLNFFKGDIDEIRVSDTVRTWDCSLNASLLSPVLNVSAYSRVMVQGDFPNGTNYTVDILDPATNNTTLQSGLMGGDPIDLSLWAVRDMPYRQLVMRLTINTTAPNISPILKKWGVGTSQSAGFKGMSNATVKSRDGVELGRNLFAGNANAVSAQLNNQYYSAVASNSMGEFIVVWGDTRLGNSDIYARRFDSSGNSIDNDIIIANGIGDQQSPCIAVNSRDEFVVAWMTNQAGNWDIYARIFDHTGFAFTGQFMVNIGSGNQGVPAIAMDRQDNFIISWNDDRSGNYNIYARRFAPDGSAQSGEVAVCTDIAMELYSAIATDSKNNVIIVYDDNRGGFGEIWMRRYDSSWSALGNEVGVSNEYQNQLYPAIAIAKDDSFIVAWSDDRLVVDYDIYAQRFDADGSKLGGNFPITNAAGDQKWPTVATDRKGTSLIAWADARNGGTNIDIYGQLLNAEGNFLLNGDMPISVAMNNQEYPSVAVASSGFFMMAWEDARGTYDNVYASVISTPHKPWGTIGTGALSPFFNTYGTLSVDVLTPERTGYWVNVTDASNNKLQTYMKNGDPILVNASQYPSIKLNLTLFTSEPSVTPVLYEWGIDLEVGTVFGNGTFRAKPVSDGAGLRLDIGDYKPLPDVSVSTNLIQRVPKVAATPSGGYVVTWCDHRNWNDDVFAQRLDRNGTVLGNDLPVSDLSTDDQLPAVGVNSKGEFVVVWTNAGNDLGDIYAQRYDAGGNKMGTNIQVCGATSEQTSPCIAFDSNDRCIIIWGDHRIGTHWELYAQIYDSDFNKIGNDFSVVAVSNDAQHPAVAALPNNRYVVSWEDRRNGSWDIYAAILNAGGAQTGGVIAACTAANAQQFPAVAVDSRGNFMIAWGDERNDGAGDIYARVFSSMTGAPLGAETVVSSALNGQGYPAVALDGEDNFIVAWHDQRNGGYEIYMKVFNSTTQQQVGGETLVINATNDQQFPSLAVGRDGRLMAVWQDYRGATSEIYGRAFYPTFFGSGSFNGSYRLPVVPQSVEYRWSSSLPSGTSVLVMARHSADNQTWSDWGNISLNRIYTQSDFTKWGPYVRYNITLNTTDETATPMLRDFRMDYSMYLVGGAMGSGIVASVSDGKIVAARPVLNCTVPAGTQLNLGLSADNGTTWDNCRNDTWEYFSSNGTALRWKAGWTGDGNGSALLKGLVIDYTSESRPSNVSIDIGGDGTVEWSTPGNLSGIMAASNLTQAINVYVLAHRAEAVGGYLTVPVNVTSATGGIVTIGETAVDFARFPMVVDYGPKGNDVPLNTSLFIQFSEPMNGTTVSAALDFTPEFVAIASWSQDGMNLTLDQPGLAEYTVYNVTLRTGARTVQGARLQNDFSWAFTTVSPAGAPPEVVFAAPTTFNIALSGAAIELGFSKPMNRSSVENGVSVEPLAVLSSPKWANDSNVSFGAVFFQPSRMHNVTVATSVTDTLGVHLAAPFTFNFTTVAVTIPTDSPKVTWWTPQGTGVPVKPTISVSFDRDMDAASVFAAISLQPPRDISSFFKINLTSFNFTLGAELDYGTRYNVTLLTSAKSLAEKFVAVPFTWSFTTISQGDPDSDLPRVVMAQPSNGALNVSPGETVTLLFSEWMNKSTTEAACSISPAVGGTWSWLLQKGYGIQFKASVAMPGGKYFVNVTSAALDESSNPLDGNQNGVIDGLGDTYSFSFTVGGGTPQVERPQLKEYTPTGEDIVPNEPIKLTFDRPMNLSSVRNAVSIVPYIDGQWQSLNGGTVFVFMPNGKYAYGRTYNVTVSTFARDLNGTNLFEGVSWSFTVEKVSVTQIEDTNWMYALVVVIAAAVGGLAFWRSRMKKKDGRWAPEEETEPKEPPAPAKGKVAQDEAEDAGDEEEEEAEAGKGKATISKKPVAAEAPTAPVVAAAAVAAAPAAKPEPRVAPEGFAIEDIFLMYRDGRLIQHATRRIKADMDVDIMTSMLTAVQSFVNESLGAADGGELGSMEYGENKIMLQKGEHVILAVVVCGGEPPEFRDEMRSTVKNIESEYSSILPQWDGGQAKLTGAKRFLATLGNYQPAERPQPTAASGHVSLKSELEFYQGFIRLKVAVKNQMDTVIRAVTFKLVYNEKNLRLDHIEPDVTRDGREVLLEDVEPREKRTVAFYLDPQICTETAVEGVLTYKDAHGNLEMLKLSRKTASVVCPIMYTDENVNTAMLKRMAAEELDKKDTKVFSVPPSLTLAKAFDIAKSAVQHHDARLVREFVEKQPFVGEAWYYGKVKGRDEKLVIRARVLGEKSLLEFFVASNSTLMLTGMLAELKADLNKELSSQKGKPSMTQVTRAEDVDAVAQIRTLLDMESEAEAGADESETR